MKKEVTVEYESDIRVSICGRGVGIKTPLVNLPFAFTLVIGYDL